MEAKKLSTTTTPTVSIDDTKRSFRFEKLRAKINDLKKKKLIPSLLRKQNKRAESSQRSQRKHKL